MLRAASRADALVAAGAHFARLALHNKSCYHKGQYNVTFLCIKSLGIQIKSA
jgi:hypothetical protein